MNPRPFSSLDTGALESEEILYPPGLIPLKPYILRGQGNSYLVISRQKLINAANASNNVLEYLYDISNQGWFFCGPTFSRQELPGVNPLTHAVFFQCNMKDGGVDQDFVADTQRHTSSLGPSKALHPSEIPRLS